MGKTLVICDSDAAAEAIGRALGGRFVRKPGSLESRKVVLGWQVGRLAGLADPARYDAGFARSALADLPLLPARFEVVARAEDEPAREQLKAIRALVRRRDIGRLVHACGSGGEGELAFAHLCELVEARQPRARVHLRALTADAIGAALASAQPVEQPSPLEDAARSRAEADWLVGVNATRAATLRGRALGGTIALGRLHTPALALLVRRERDTLEPLAEDALYSGVPERLLELGYAVREGPGLRPTAKGVQVIDLLGDSPLASPELAARWEERLAAIERGEETREAYMREVVAFTTEIVEHLRELPEERTRFPRRDLEIACPRCREGSLIENRKGFGCSSWRSREEPGCGFVIWKTIAGRQIDEAIVRELVGRGRTRELTGFRSRTGKAFRAHLVLDPEAEQPVTFGFSARG